MCKCGGQCKSPRKPFVDEAINLVYGGGRDYSHPLIQHLNAGMRQAIRNGDAKWCDPISIAENSIYMKESRNDGKEKVDNRTDTIGYHLCIGMMCELYWDMGYVEVGDELGALEGLRNLDFHGMWELYVRAKNYVDRKDWVVADSVERTSDIVARDLTEL